MLINLSGGAKLALSIYENLFANPIIKYISFMFSLKKAAYNSLLLGADFCLKFSSIIKLTTYVFVKTKRQSKY